jgi:hypothetical protein
MTSTPFGPGPMDPRPTPDPRPASLAEHILYPEWGPIVAGGIAASALALVLHAFAVAIGLSVSSTAPTWRDASFALACCPAFIWSWQRSRLTGSAVTWQAYCAREHRLGTMPPCAMACTASVKRRTSW